MLIRKGRADVDLMMPNRADVTELKVGDKAPNPFGTLSRVTGVTHHSMQNNRAHVAYFVEHGPGGTISYSMREGELVRSSNVVARYTLGELNRIEAEMRNEMRKEL